MSEPRTLGQVARDWCRLFPRLRNRDDAWRRVPLDVLLEACLKRVLEAEAQGERRWTRCRELLKKLVEEGEE